MISPHDFELWHALHSLEARYWRDVDCNDGRNAHQFFRPDGVMVVGRNRFEGRDRIREFYDWRARQATTSISSVKTTRHLISNFIVERIDDGRANGRAIICFYGTALRAPATQSSPPMLIADLLSDCMLDANEGWQFKSHTLSPVFMSRDHPPSLAVDAERHPA